MSKVPEGWVNKTLENLIKINSDSLGSNTSDEYEFFYIDLSMVDNGKISYPKEKIKYKNASPRARRRIRCGDILLSTVRPNLRGFGKVREDIANLICSTGFAVLRSEQHETADYLYQYIFSDFIYGQIDSLVVGSNYPAINNSDVANLKITIPKSLTQQHKIAKILSTWDKTIEATEKLIANSQQQKKSLMQQLLTGKKRFQKVPDKWHEVKLGEIVEFLDGQRKPIKSEDREKINGIYPYYGATGIIDWVNNYIFDEDLILMGEDGENIISRNLPHVFKIKGKSWVNNHAHVIKPKSTVNIDYLCNFLENLNYKKYNSGSAQPKLNKKICESLPVLLPTLFEQAEISAILSASDRETETLQQKLNYLKQEKQALMQQLLTGKRRVKIDSPVTDNVEVC